MCANGYGQMELLEARRLFAAGDLDSLFAGGKLTQDLAGGDDYGFAVTVQADGKILVAGRTSTGGATGNDFAVVRFNADGTLDSSFGAGGIVKTDMGSDSDCIYAIVVQADGKIVVGGETTRAKTSTDFALVRYNANGTLDTTFAGTGKVVTDFVSSRDQLTSLALTPDGRILAAGWATSSLPRFAMVKYNSVGQLDTTFGSGGRVTTSYSLGYSKAQSVKVLGSGVILLTGGAYTLATGECHLAATRYTSTGQLDTTFGVSGWATVNAGANDEAAEEILVQSDGKYVLAGTSHSTVSGTADFVMARLNLNGALDTTFGSSGVVRTDFAAEWDQSTSAAMQSDGRIVVAGYTTIGGINYFGVARFTTAGTLDSAFSQDGKATVGFAAAAIGNSVVIDQNGHVVVAGTATNINGSHDFAVARLIGRFNIPPLANAGGPYYVNAEQTILLNGAGSTDSDGSIVQYEWDFDYDGISFDVNGTGVNPSYSAAGLSGTVRTIALRVTDDGGKSNVATTTVTINALPVASAGGPYAVDADQSITLSGAGSFDTDGSIATYEWDFNYDGVSFDADSTGANPTYSAAGLSGVTRTIALRVTDNVGATTLSTTTVTINALPMADAGGPYTVDADGAVTLIGEGSIDDDGSIVSYEWDFDYDGVSFNADSTDANPSFSADGLSGVVRTFALRVTDNSGATNVVTTTITVNLLPPPPPPPPPPDPDPTPEPAPEPPPTATGGPVMTEVDPASPGKQVLIVRGTDNSDLIRFRSTSNGKIEVRVNGKRLGLFASVSRIVAYGGAGNDIIEASCVKVPVEFLGEAGNDLLIGGRCNDILSGGDGNDKLHGNNGNDLLVGGEGKDKLHGLFGRNLLVGGKLSADDNLSLLRSVLASWCNQAVATAATAPPSPSPTTVEDSARGRLFGTKGKDELIGAGADNSHLNKAKKK